MWKVKGNYSIMYEYYIKWLIPNGKWSRFGTFHPQIPVHDTNIISTWTRNRKVPYFWKRAASMAVKYPEESTNILHILGDVRILKWGWRSKFAGFIQNNLVPSELYCVKHHVSHLHFFAVSLHRWQRILQAVAVTLLAIFGCDRLRKITTHFQARGINLFLLNEVRIKAPLLSSDSSVSSVSSNK